MLAASFLCECINPRSRQILGNGLENRTLNLLSQLVNEHQNPERAPEHARGQHRRFSMAHYWNIQQAQRR
jgi:hypothetical protein